MMKLIRKRMPLLATLALVLGGAFLFSGCADEGELIEAVVVKGKIYRDGAPVSNQPVDIEYRWLEQGVLRSMSLHVLIEENGAFNRPMFVTSGYGLTNGVDFEWVGSTVTLEDGKKVSGCEKSAQLVLNTPSTGDANSRDRYLYTVETTYDFDHPEDCSAAPTAFDPTPMQPEPAPSESPTVLK